jgi:steroid 5-alpha reductase family enzyme
METYHTTNPWGGSLNVSLPPPTTGAAPDTAHSSPTPLSSLIDIGLLKSTLLPSLSINSALGLIAYTAGRLTDRLETKDIIWPLAPVLDAWYAAVLRHTTPFSSITSEGDRVTLSTAWRALGSSDRLLLGGVTLWGARLAYRVATRAWRRGRDDPRYDAVKHRRGLGVWGGKTAVGKGGFWDWAWLSAYLPEAVFQSVIALSVTTPFRLGLGGLGLGRGVFEVGEYREIGQALAVGLFSAGFALEVLADWQLAEFKEKAESQGKMCREGVWGVVRHPK